MTPDERRHTATELDCIAVDVRLLPITRCSLDLHRGEHLRPPRPKRKQNPALIISDVFISENVDFLLTMSKIIVLLGTFSDRSKRCRCLKPA
jgi:hypothetical protein